MAIDTSKTKDSLFGNFKKISPPLMEAQNSEEAKQEILEIPQSPVVENTKSIPPSSNNSVNHGISPKWQSFDKVTALLTTDQKNGLDRVAKKLMKYRSRELKGIEEKERITANTLIRALIENFLKMEDSIDLAVLSSEDEVIEWVKKAFKI